ncbi:MAG: hypothetical protein SGARI_003090 [Bacillariaceae sp.]
MSQNATAKVAATGPLYAYAFVVGGCDPLHPGYRGFLYNILVAAHVLHREGSKADIVAYFQISADYDGEHLPEEEERHLAESGVQLSYLPKPQSGRGTFYDVVMEKFRILKMTQYRRVLFLDADILPKANLDYIFELSDPSVPGLNPILKPNLIYANRKEPANAGLFMLAPQEGELEKLLEIIRIREEKAKDLPPPHFDEVEGWGHAIQPPDEWKSGGLSGTKWDYWAAKSDQGLLYHWTKYVKGSVSQVINNKVYNWQWNKTTQTLDLDILDNAFRQEGQPHCDFQHFTGPHRKPWKKLKSLPADFYITDYDNSTGFTKWFHVLSMVNEKLHMGLNMSDWGTISNQIGGMPLGPKAKDSDMVARVIAQGTAQ